MAATLKFPVAVLMARREVKRGQWTFPSWEAESVIAGENAAPGAPTRCELPAQDSVRQVLWTGMILELNRDGTESYWWNLLGARPSLFVICHEDEDNELRPLRVTADHDEAGAAMEGDAKVFRAPIPPEIYKQIEAYIVAHHRPQQRRKRRREEWKEDQPE